MTASGVEDARTVVTEACGNSIKHAYAGEATGCLEVNAHVENGDLCLVIRDFGPGIGSRSAAASASLHAGLLIIGALSRAFRLSSRRGAGTVLEAWLPLEAA
jgi:anti-sigma regulatory factor (Ser/Thr protein kinase)